jgi:hypothetical protein
MWSRQIHWLSSKDVNVTSIGCSDGVVRQMHMKGKNRDAIEITALVQVSINRLIVSGPI